MSLFNNRALTLLTVFLTVFLLCIPATTAAPHPADTAGPPPFIVNIYSGPLSCSPHDLTTVCEGASVHGAACFSVGGNAFWLTQSGGCKAQAWSGNNCRGSSSKLTDVRICQTVPFGSILVVC